MRQAVFIISAELKDFMDLLKKTLIGSIACLGFFTWSPQADASIVSLEKDPKDQWTLVVDGEDYFIRGIEYRVSKVGQSPDLGTLKDWATYDENHNGKCDPAYDSWVDQNKNGRRDRDEPIVGDFELLRRMGVNTIRWYANSYKGSRGSQEILRDLFHTYGIRVAVGDMFGAYTIGSGAAWSHGTDYRDAGQRQRMLQSVEQTVMAHKEEPYTLLWILGNENNLSFTNTNAGKYPAEYAQFLNEAAQLIHRLDGKHPVAFINGDTQFLSQYKKYCSDIDIFGVNCYRGPSGFGRLWNEVSRAYGKPVLITEYGGNKAHGLDEKAQALYHSNCWKDILKNRAGSGTGNAIGGMAYEWLDEWWQAGDPVHQAKEGVVGLQGANKAANWDLEYSGIASQGDGKKSPFLRQLRKVYWAYQKLWNEKPAEPQN